MVFFDIESLGFTIGLNIPVESCAIRDVLDDNYNFIWIVTSVQIFYETIFLLAGYFKVNDLYILWGHRELQIEVFYVFVVPYEKIFIVHLKLNF
jgi:hypothetical protein